MVEVHGSEFLVRVIVLVPVVLSLGQEMGSRTSWRPVSSASAFSEEQRSLSELGRKVKMQNEASVATMLGIRGEALTGILFYWARFGHHTVIHDADCKRWKVADL